ncbi:unnamed protein product [Cylicocyclus nassatus]|uniref:Secreted protein n=1 Tax=Cylicocyclus nassatus TaxID=53992 RepID=A0AA36GC37_CYLNA|nr:unnamed protein product [Cylicocyclus nassatus]
MKSSWLLFTCLVIVASVQGEDDDPADPPPLPYDDDTQPPEATTQPPMEGITTQPPIPTHRSNPPQTQNAQGGEDELDIIMREHVSALVNDARERLRAITPGAELPPDANLADQVKKAFEKQEKEKSKNENQDSEFHGLLRKIVYDQWKNKNSETKSETTGGTNG